VVGHWQDEKVRDKIRTWARALLGLVAGKNLKIARFGDNMRDVAVTEGDKVEAQLRFGWSVNGYGLADLVDHLATVPESAVENKLASYRAAYQMPVSGLAAVAYQARLELALEGFLEEGGFGGFTTTFENLAGLEQLPGLAVQNLMAKGYGFGAEGDWKTAGLLRTMKMMSAGLAGGNSFMEDYTYHLAPGREQVLGAHMLEVCPSIARDKPAIQVHELGIGGKAAPARLVFTGRSGPAILVTLVDLGNRFRLIVNDVYAEAPEKAMPRLPVAGVMWQPLPDLYQATEAWLAAGGAHHSVLSYDLDINHMRDLARILDLELVHISRATDPGLLADRLALDDILWRLKN
jgi:L-arabinose isomerase